jgi:N-acetyl sugar amidotransferase
MPDTRPGISFNAKGVCQACVNYEKRKKIDWKKRERELATLCDRYRGSNGQGYDCIIAVSGGKDSHWQTHVMKERFGMTPLLVTVEDNFPMTDAGIHNIQNLSETFGCDIISLKPNRRAQKQIMRFTFETYGMPTWYIDRLIYTYPLHMAVKFGIPLVVYGENISFEYGGAQKEETYSARDQISNGVAMNLSFKEIVSEEVPEKDLSLLAAPRPEDLEKIDPVYLSYFLSWNSFSNYVFAKSRGFRDLTHEWDRTHHVENFDQVDSRAYLVHPWLKYPKFGHASATDYAARFVRYGLLTRDEAVRLVKERDHRLDPKAVRDFCNFLGYQDTEFWRIVDKFYNRDIFKKDEFGRWVLKSPVWK